MNLCKKIVAVTHKRDSQIERNNVFFKAVVLAALPGLVSSQGNQTEASRNNKTENNAFLVIYICCIAIEIVAFSCRKKEEMNYLFLAKIILAPLDLAYVGIEAIKKIIAKKIDVALPPNLNLEFAHRATRPDPNNTPEPDTPTIEFQITEEIPL